MKFYNVIQHGILSIVRLQNCTVKHLIFAA